jgi:hypothetical protein
MLKPIVNSVATFVVAGATLFHAQNVVAQTAIDNASLSSSNFRQHERTFGLVYTLPKEVNEVLAATIGGLLKEDLLQAGLATEAQMFNIPHVTVVHIHSADITTPGKMLRALPGTSGHA